MTNNDYTNEVPGAQASGRGTAEYVPGDDTVEVYDHDEPGQPPINLPLSAAPIESHADAEAYLLSHKIRVIGQWTDHSDDPQWPQFRAEVELLPVETPADDRFPGRAQAGDRGTVMYQFGTHNVDVYDPQDQSKEPLGLTPPIEPVTSHADAETHLLSHRFRVIGQWTDEGDGEFHAEVEFLGFVDQD